MDILVVFSLDLLLLKVLLVFIGKILYMYMDLFYFCCFIYFIREVEMDLGGVEGISWGVW